MTAIHLDMRQGDALTVLRGMPGASVSCVVTSPPYYGQRDYGVDGQTGMEDTPAEYVEAVRAVFAEVQRILTGDGTLWLNIDDSRYSGRGRPGPGGIDTKQRSRRGWMRPLDRTRQPWAKPKSLLLVPSMLALALLGDGWILRNEIIWHKPNATPDPTCDRLPHTYERIFMFSKSRFYRFDRAAAGGFGDVWSVPTRTLKGASVAPMTLEIARRCILIGSRPGDVVLDPYAGGGTTGVVALELGRGFVGIDLRPLPDLVVAS